MSSTFQQDNKVLRLAIQKSGRLNEKSLHLLQQSGIRFDSPRGRLVCPSENFPIEVMLVRDDDIPGYVRDGACDLGIVGYNEYHEQIVATTHSPAPQKARDLKFGRCKLSLAVPKERESEFNSSEDFAGARIATSYPNSVKKFFESRGINVEPVEIAGSVEIAPSMGIADVICDLVSSGQTLRANGLTPVLTIYESQAVLIQRAGEMNADLQKAMDSLFKRLDGVMKASSSKYIMMNAPTSAVQEIKEVVPGLETPTIMPLDGVDDKVAIHVVAREDVFWETMEHLKELGASSILVVPIEKMLD